MWEQEKTGWLFGSRTHEMVICPCLCHKGITGIGGVATLIINLSSSWGEWSASLLGRLKLTERTSSPIVEEAGWTPEPVWIFWRRKHIIPLPEIEARSVDHRAHSLATTPT